MFKDTEFVPGLQTLGSYSNNYLDEILKKVIWHELDNRSPKFVLFDEISPLDFTQGFNANLDFLSAIIALSYTPSMIQRIFFTKDLGSTTKYSLQLYIHGLPTMFKLDLSFPFMDSLEFAFIRPRPVLSGTQLWPVFLEKLWAKRSGCYFTGDPQSLNSILNELTGAPVEVVHTCNSSIGNKLIEALKNKFTVVAVPKIHAFDLKTVQINPLFAYTVKEFQNSKVLLKNPLGFSSIPGDADNKNYEESGVFVDFSLFSDRFDYISILHYHESFKYSYKQSSKNCFQVSIFEDGPCYFSAYQQNNEDSPLRIIVADAQGYIKGKSSIGCYIWIEINCTPGTYYVYTEKSQNQVFSVYSQMNAGIEEIEEASFFSRNFSVSTIKNLPQVFKVEVCQGVTAYCLEKIGRLEDEFNEGFIFDVIENTLEDFKALVEIQADFSNYEIVGKTEMVVNPKSSELLYLKQKELGGDTLLNANIKAKLVPI